MGRKKSITQPIVVAMQVRRLLFLSICLVSGFGFLGYRLYDLQVVQHEALGELARNNTERTIVRQARRGDIKDIRGNLLATSKDVVSVCADPDFLGTNYLQAAKIAAPILDIPFEELASRLQPRLRKNEKGEMIPVRYVCVKRKVEEEEWRRLQDAMRQMRFGVDESKLKSAEKTAYNWLRAKAFFPQADQMRFYPNGSLAAHVLGYVGMRETESIKGKVLETSGKDGIELSLNSELSGVEGWRQTETDSRHRELVLFREQEMAPKNGLNAILTIDSGIQHILEDELSTAFEKHTPISVSGIVIRPKTGEIVAMATFPNFDPNQPGEAKPAERRNRIITDQAEPGSTFKIVVVSAALNEGLVNLSDVFDCENGHFFFAGKPLRDDHPFGVLTVEGIIAKSSNIGAAKVGFKLGEQRLYEYVKAFGFGHRTGITLPGEINGQFAPPSRWSKLSISRIPMGHEIACTPLQMAMAMSAIANKGVLMRPMLVDRLTDETGRAIAKYSPQPVRRVVSAEAAAKMTAALKVVVSTNGTGTKARLNYYTAAGKTGTAQKIINGQYTRSKHFSSFIGFFPADNPELCISIVFDEPKKGYYGSETGAPVFQRVAERAANYLAIPPEFVREQNLIAATNHTTAD